MSSDEHKKDGHEGGGGGHGGGHGGGGGGHEEHEEHEGAPEWLISFADNVTLMMGFFVVLLAMNMGPKGGAPDSTNPSSAAAAGTGSSPDMIDFAIAIREAFNNPVDVNAPKPGELVMVRRILERRAKGEAEDDGATGNREKVQSINRGDYHALSGMVLFEHRSAALSARGRDQIVELAQHLRGMRLVVEIRGHVSAEEAFHTEDRGMRLSFDRSLAVAQALAGAGVEWRMLRLVPCGDNDRVRKLAYDKQSHAQNERVEVVITEETAE